MSTRSYILMEQDDGQYKGVYCHSDESGSGKRHRPPLRKYVLSPAFLGRSTRRG